MTLSTAQYRAKATTAATAWQRVVGAPPVQNALVLAMAVADLETGLGSVAGHNWGFVHKRTLTADEQWTLDAEGVKPTDGNTALAAAKKLLTPGKNEILTIDGSPRGPYFVWMWAFPGDEEAAEKFLTVLVVHRPGVRAIIDTATPVELATAMYASKYFEGESPDPQTNINAYGASIANHAMKISAALVGWTPPTPAAPPPNTPPAGPPALPPPATPIASSRSSNKLGALALVIVAVVTVAGSRT